MNAANEVAVQAFLDGRIPFQGITDVVGEGLSRHETRDASTLEAVLEADRRAREQAETACAAGPRG